MKLDLLATFDCLYLANRLEKRLGGFSAAEIHLLTYLACLLWMYRHNPPSDWGYTFSGTEFGAPFSVAVNTTVDTLEERGFFVRSQGRLEMSVQAKNQLALLASLSLHQERIECLQAAAATITAFTVGIVREALGQEPDLKRAKDVPASRILLDENPTLKVLYDQFDVLREVLGDTRKDLRLPAVVWLTALYENTRKEGVVS